MNFSACLGVAGRQRVGIDGGLDDFFIAEQRDRRPHLAHSRRGRGNHVFTVGCAEPAVESLTRRQERQLIAQVPLANAHGAVPLLLEDLRHGGFARGKAFLRDRLQHPPPRAAHLHAHPSRVTTGHESRSRRRADAGGDAETGQLHALSGHAVQMRRAIDLRSIAPQVSVSQIVGDDQDEIRLRFGPDHGAAKHAGQQDHATSESLPHDRNLLVKADKVKTGKANGGSPCGDRCPPRYSNPPRPNEAGRSDSRLIN